ncbi:sensor domain-containing diguanylate cyclase [Salinarimonas soli]|uniref:diguanylate cyclase n=1 Tax=Salinarimonas soli TaxID=1638099 RepID=A0A5B2VHM5_9HYPH|nr:sensor domain-containing diguanylate cyclase [Salinarimonas soli]KAA2238108.1 GGDEF domain-containing protein [Salinarimonas soli]
MFREIHDDRIEQRAAAPEIRVLLEAYRASHARHGFARYADLGPEARPDLAGDLVVLRPINRTNFRYEAYGERIAAVTGISLTGQTLDCLGGELRRFYRETYHRAMRSGLPLYTMHRSTYALNVYAWERLVVPVMDEAGQRLVVVLNKPQELRDNLLSAVLAASRDGILAMRTKRDEAGEIVDCEIVTANTRAAEICGRPCDALVGSSLLTAFPGLVEAGFWDLYKRVIVERTTEQFEAPYASDGIDGYFRVTAVPLDDGLTLSLTDITELKSALHVAEERNGELERAVAALEAARVELALEVRARRTAEGELRRIATLDHLTGILNRRGFDRRVRDETERCRRTECALSVIAMDLDHFKSVNDRRGHAAGDAVLVQVAEIVGEALRPDLDAFGRVGGEEFMILLAGTGPQAAAALAERLRQHLAATPVQVGSERFTITASFGVASLGGGFDAERMLLDADGALYKAKRAGRDRVVTAEAAGRQAAAVA